MRALSLRRRDTKNHHDSCKYNNSFWHRLLLNRFFRSWITITAQTVKVAPIAKKGRAEKPDYFVVSLSGAVPLLRGL
jgi:hypothetical protein